jgi:hypothetical protein
MPGIRYDDGGEGASRARNKLAAFLRERGVAVPTWPDPPTDDDFWDAIKQFAKRYGANLPRPRGFEQLEDIRRFLPRHR